MNFLAPLFLLGALAVIGPVIFHLIRRTTREKTPFSTLMFLQPTPPRITRRSRLENLWLLLLRCAVIALLATAFARPFFRDKADNAIGTAGKSRMVIMVDTSASMRREGFWAEAVAKANEQVRRAAPGDEVALVAFDRTVRPLLTFEEWNQLRPGDRDEIAEQRFDAIAPSWSATQLGAAMIRASELLESKGDAEPVARRMVIVSDLQEGADIDGLQGYEWPRATAVEFVQVGKPAVANVSLQWVPESDESQSASETQPLRLRVTNSAGNPAEQFKIQWVSKSVAAAESPRAETVEPTNRPDQDSSSPQIASPEIPAYVPAGQSRTVRVPRASGADKTSLTISGDEVAFDNTVYLLPPQPIRIPILYLGNKAAADPAGLHYYLDRAFPKTRSQNIEIISNTDGVSVPSFRADEAQLVVLGESAGTADITVARKAAAAGRIVIFPLTGADSASTLAGLLERSTIAVSEAEVKDYALLGEIDFTHPLFSPFADPRFSDFTKIHFWKYRRIDPAQLPEARVVAKFDRGDPAILQVPVGRGSVVIFASTWRPDDSQLALSSKFVPLLHALLEQSTDIPVSKAQYFVGDTIPLPAGAGLTVKKPDETVATLNVDTSSIECDLPGIYTASPGNRRFVVNLSPDESRLGPLPVDRFAALGVPLQPPILDPSTIAQKAAAAQAIELEGRQKVWRWMIAAALGVLLLETLIAGKLSGAQRSSTVPTS